MGAEKALDSGSFLEGGTVGSPWVLASLGTQHQASRMQGSSISLRVISDE